MRVVSDTSPILNLAIVGQLNLLAQQFGEVLIPPAVEAELRLDTELPGTTVLRKALERGWVHTVAVSDALLVAALRHELNPGEAEAIALAAETASRRVLIDEADGRAVARRLGLQPIGVVGILLRAKRDGSLPSVGDALQVLVDEAGFYLSEDLRRAVLAEAGEPSVGAGDG